MSALVPGVHPKTRRIKNPETNPQSFSCRSWALEITSFVTAFHNGFNDPMSCLHGNDIISFKKVPWQAAQSPWSSCLQLETPPCSAVWVFTWWVHQFTVIAGDSGYRARHSCCYDIEILIPVFMSQSQGWIIWETLSLQLGMMLQSNHRSRRLSAMKPPSFPF